MFTFSHLHKIVPLVLLLVHIGALKADDKDKKYPVSEIPVVLRLKAHAVLRVDEQYFTVISEGKGRLTHKYAYTILDEKAEELSQISLFYSSLNKITSLKGTLYDQYGNEISSLKKSDIQDESVSDGFSFQDDGREKLAGFSYTQYPYTVEFEYEKVYDGLLFYPGWYPQIDTYIGVQNAFYEVSIPKEMQLRYKEYNMPRQASKTEDGGNYIYRWSVKNLEPFRQEPYSAEPLYPAVLLAPSQFSMGKYKGDMSTWKSYGEWQNQLNEGTNDLPESTQNLIKDLVKNTDSEIEKVRLVYEYLQSRVRYVSIQLGIGGWQPFKASFVDEKAYGDCKALSNYTKSLLEVIGIESHYTLVNAGKYAREIRKDFPTQQFNHVILCVPLARDTVWLECTSQSDPFGYMGEFTGNRDALIITPEGGKLVRTPYYGKNENIQERFAEVIIQENGDAKVNVTTKYNALQEGRLPFVIDYAPEEQKKWLYRNLDIPSFEIEEFSFTRRKDRIPVTTEKLSLNVRKCVTISGKRIFLVPNLLNKVTSAASKTEDRKSNVKLRYAYQHIDSIQYQIPEKYILEYKPEDVEISSDFGKYTVKYELKENILQYTRKFEMNKGIFPKESYNNLIEFINQIIKADKSKIVFIKET